MNGIGLPPRDDAEARDGLGEELHDLDDVRYLLRHLTITTAADTLAIVTRYFDESQIPRMTRLALEELLPG